jgi:hypothetical protein
VLSDEKSWQLEYLRSALSRGAVIIAGTSYRDPDVRQWFHAARKTAPTGHAVLVLLARQGFNMDKSDFLALEAALLKQWEAVGFRAILLNDHSDAAQVIRELRFVNDASYMAPQERAKAIWQHHQSQFDALQKEYVKALRKDSETIRPALDTDESNTTLWLSNGDGQLIRWAAEDRIYLDSAGLRSVRTGFDSPWIAGRALGADTLLIQDIDSASTSRWKSVLAIPIPAPHPKLPPMSAAVLTIGLPKRAEEYESSKLLWVEILTAIADTWSGRLTQHVFPG